MSVWAFIASLFSGGVTGVLGQLGVGILDEWKAGRESARKIAEMRALAEIKTEEAAWNAFAASQKASEVPANAPAWCAAVLTLWRPFLTLLFFGLAAYGFGVADAVKRGEMMSEVNACAFGLAWWWCGARYQSRLRSGPTK